MKGCLKSSINIFQRFSYMLIVSIFVSVSLSLVTTLNLSFARTDSYNVSKVQDNSKDILSESKIKLLNDTKPEFITLTSGKQKDNEEDDESGKGKGLGHEKDKGKGHEKGKGKGHDKYDTTTTTTTTLPPVSKTLQSETNYLVSKE
jgi:hypothetical protein